MLALRSGETRHRSSVEQSHGPVQLDPDTIGNTPVVRLNRIAPDHVTLYAKVESFNPGGSVKDRLALAIIPTPKPAGAQARRHHRGGHLGQHRRGAGDGGGRARLQVRGHDGGDLLHRAPQLMRLRRQGDPDAGRRARFGHGQARPRAGRGTRLVPRPASSPTRPTRPTTATPRRPRSCVTSPARGWITS